MPYHVLCIGAHPDDCEGSVGGTAVLFRRRGDRVKFISMTDGSRGHYLPETQQTVPRLTIRRRMESMEAARVAGVEFQNLGLRDGEVYVDRETTEMMIRLIRRESPDLILINRPCDYHRDHRYTAQLVLDAAYMLTVPLYCQDVPALRHMPVIAYWQDTFTEFGPFRPDIAVPIDAVIETKRDMMLAHASQYLEWLPYNSGPGTPLGDLPEDRYARARAAGEVLMDRSRRVAERYRAHLPAGTEFAEAFQVSEYGRPMVREELQVLFPYTPST
jgi:LmbE family N-acetylglucosaminyl deacetylase